MVREHDRNEAALFIFAGLPGVGKSSLAKALSQYLQAVYLRIDTIEQGMRDLCAFDVQGEGYRLAYRIALDNLRLGHNVVADSCNPIELTRREWEQVALDAGATCTNIEVVCSKPDQHRARVERRAPEIEGLRLPTWHEVQSRDYDPWTTDRIVIDTANRSEADCVNELKRLLAASAVTMREMHET